MFLSQLKDNGQAQQERRKEEKKEDRKQKVCGKHSFTKYYVLPTSGDRDPFQLFESRQPRPPRAMRVYSYIVQPACVLALLLFFTEPIDYQYP